MVSERVRAIFQAIDFGLDGYSQVQSALKCFPKKDFENIKAEIDELERKRIYDLKMCRTVNHRKTHNQEFALNVAGIIVTYLDSIGQWWYKKEAVERSGYVSLYNEQGT